MKLWESSHSLRGLPQGFFLCASGGHLRSKFPGRLPHASSLQGPLSALAFAEFTDLRQYLEHLVLQPNDHDAWHYHCQKPFSAGRFYNHYFDALPKHPFLMHVWKSKCVIKHKVFAWLLVVDRLNTRNMLKHRNYTINSGWNCLLCPSPPKEYLDHLFFSCSFSRDCWDDLGIHWRMNLPLMDRLLHAKSTWRRGLFWEIFVLDLAAWTLWKVRNAKLFENILPLKSTWRVLLRTELKLLAHRSAKEQFQINLDQLLQQLAL